MNEHLEHTSEHKTSFLQYKALEVHRASGQGEAVSLIFKVLLAALSFSVNIQTVGFSIADRKELLAGLLCGVLWC